MTPGLDCLGGSCSGLIYILKENIWTHFELEGEHQMSSAVPVYFLVYILGYDLVIVSDLSFADSQQ